VWQRELREDTDARLPQWGFASSPTLVDDFVLVFVGGGAGKGVAAYRRDSGDLAWTGGDGSHGYSSVEPVAIAGMPQYLIASSSGIQSLDPSSGKVLWGHDWPVSGNPRVVQPALLDGNAVYLGTAAGMGLRKLRISKEDQTWTATEEWTTRKFRPYFNDFVYHAGHFYGYDGNRLACIDAASGEEKWRGDRVGGQVLLLPAMDMLLVLTEQGSVMLVPAVPDAYSVAAEFQAISGKTWNHPVIAHGRLYVRNSSEAACFELPR
jgi:outer membrane protein assembly factor BamB